MGKVREKVKIFLESVTKTVLYVTCTPLNSNVESLTLPLIDIYLVVGMTEASSYTLTKIGYYINI